MYHTSNNLTQNKAQVDFKCFSETCQGIVSFDLNSITQPDFQAICPSCHHSYSFDQELKEKLKKLQSLIIAVRDAEEILGDCNVAVTVPGGEVKVPYVLLLTRLNTMITLNVGKTKVDFHFRIEPSSPQTFK